jgi:hypothetical protein
VTIKDNPSRQTPERKIKEVSFYTGGEYYGLLLDLNVIGGEPHLNVYSIDEGIQVRVAEEREKRV